jgi:hypothetical protein
MIDYRYDNSSIIVNLFLLALYIDVLSFDKFMTLQLQWDSRVFWGYVWMEGFEVLSICFGIYVSF